MAGGENMLTIQKAGLFSTVQDLGRTGFQHVGVIVSGVMDKWAHQLANLLVGNPLHEATIEMTISGLTFTVSDDRILAFTGADMQPTINGQPIRMHQPVAVQAGDEICCSIANDGLRTYLAISGGLDIPIVLGSKSTYLAAQFGGWNGRTLQDGDQIPCLPLTDGQRQRFEQLIQQPVRWTVQTKDFYSSLQSPVIRYTAGLDQAMITTDSLQAFEQITYQLSARSNRMGFHLEAKEALQLKENTQMLSEAVCKGTVQLPPSGFPMILMADAQTVGGYPKIGQVIHADYSTLAQLQPHQPFTFQEVDLSTATSINREQAYQWKLIQIGVNHQFNA